MKKPRPAKTSGAAKSKTPTSKNGQAKTERKLTWRPSNHRMQGIREDLAWHYDHPDSGKPLMNCRSWAERFETCEETIRRDLEFMTYREGLPIEYDKKRHGYRFTEKVALLGARPFTEKELAALCFVRLRADAFQRTLFDDTLNSALDKLLLTLGDEFTAEATRMAELISFRPSGFPALLDFGTFERIYGALREQVELELNYVAFSGENAGKQSVRTVQPRHLTCHENGWYLRTDDLRSGKERTFLLSRMAAVKPTGKRFTPKKKLNLKKIKKGFSIFDTVKEQTVRLHCSSAIRQLIVERLWHESQEFTDLPDGGVELKLQIGIDPELVRLICGWQGHVKVIQPESLREQIREAGRRLAE